MRTHFVWVGILVGLFGCRSQLSQWTGPLREIALGTGLTPGSGTCAEETQLPSESERRQTCAATRGDTTVAVTTLLRTGEVIRVTRRWHASSLRDAAESAQLRLSLNFREPARECRDADIAVGWRWDTPQYIVTLHAVLADSTIQLSYRTASSASIDCP